jgi:hypothetical protein
VKLSEAILLGSTVVAANPGQQYFSETEAGCALGMAAIARGCRFLPVVGSVPEKDRRTFRVEGIWGKWVLRVVMRPCECPLDLPREMRIKDIIAHLFDCHVAGKKNWTLDQLVAWVQAWEPKEANPVIADRVPFAKASSPEPRVEAAREWQETREAFNARHKSRRSSTRSALGNW